MCNRRLAVSLLALVSAIPAQTWVQKQVFMGVRLLHQGLLRILHSLILSLENI